MTVGRHAASRLLLLVVVGVVVGLTAVSAAGVRGSDQFWYVADVESIARGDGAVTNTVFPHPLLRQQAEPPYAPIHHNPLLYVVAPLAGLIGGYGAWLVLNVAWVLATALLVRSLLIVWVEEPLANLAAALFALMPATFWQAGQPLADASLAFLVMLCVWSLCRPGPALWHWPLAYASLLIAALCREFFALPLLLLPWLYGRWSGGGRRKALWAALMLLVAIGALAVKSDLFPQQLEFSPAAAWRQLATRAPDMFLYFDLQLAPETTIGELVGAAVSRLARALREHLRPPLRQSVFYLPFMALCVVALSGWWARRRLAVSRRLLWIVTGLVALHLAVITTQHASFRYAFVITAPLLVAAVVRCQRLARPGSAVGRWIWAVALVGSLAVDVALADKNRREGRLVRDLSVSSRQVLDRFVAPGEAVAFEAIGLGPGVWYLWVGHVLPRSTVLYLDPRFPYDSPTYDRLRERSGAVWLICRRGSPLRAALDAEPEPLARLPTPVAGWEVYRLPRPVEPMRADTVLQ